MRLVKQNKTKQNKTKQNKTKQNKTKQNKTKQNKTKQNKTKQNKTKQNKTKQNKTKQNKHKQSVDTRTGCAIVSTQTATLSFRHPHQRSFVLLAPPVPPLLTPLRPPPRPPPRAPLHPPHLRRLSPQRESYQIHSLFPPRCFDQLHCPFGPPIYVEWQQLLVVLSPLQYLLSPQVWKLH